jgi:hypothetical protein
MDAADPSAVNGAADGETQLALDHDPSDDPARTQAPPEALDKRVDMAAVARLRERHPEVRDWPLEELVKPAPSIIREERAAEREREAGA